MALEIIALTASFSAIALAAAQALSKWLHSRRSVELKIQTEGTTIKFDPKALTADEVKRIVELIVKNESTTPSPSKDAEQKLDDLGTKPP